MGVGVVRPWAPRPSPALPRRTEVWPACGQYWVSGPQSSSPLPEPSPPRRGVRKAKVRSAVFCVLPNPRVAWDMVQAQGTTPSPLPLPTSRHQPGCLYSVLASKGEKRLSSALRGPSLIPALSGSHSGIGSYLHLNFDVWFSMYVITLMWIF